MQLLHADGRDILLSTVYHQRHGYFWN